MKIAAGRRSTALIVGICTVGILAGCGGSSTLSFPAVAPIVNAALPTALKSTSSLMIRQNASPARAALPAPVLPKGILRTTPTNTPSYEMTNVVTSIQALFTNMYVDSNSGGTHQGFINSLVSTIDGRMTSVNQQISGSSSACLKATPTSYTIDASNIDPVMKLTLNNVQCASTFSNNTGGSGVLFGSSGTSYSMQMSLGPMSGTGTNFFQLGGFFAAANVKNVNSTSASAPEQVDGFLVSYQTGASSSPQMSVARFIATPTNNTFELFFASNEPNIQGPSAGTDNWVGMGFRMISDGQHIYTDGIIYDKTNQVSNGGQAANTYYIYNACINASSATMTLDNTPSDCTTLANSFTLATTPSLNFAEVTGYPSLTVPASPGYCAAVAQSATPAGACPPQYGPPGTVALSSVFTGLNTYFPVTNAGVASL